VSWQEVSQPHVTATGPGVKGISVETVNSADAPICQHTLKESIEVAYEKERLTRDRVPLLSTRRSAR